MAMAEVVNQPNSVVVSNMVPSNSENSITPMGHDFSRNPMDPLGVGYEGNRSLVCPSSDVNEALQSLMDKNEFKSHSRPTSDEKSPMNNIQKNSDYTYNRSQGVPGQFQAVPGLQPRTLFQQIGDPNVRETNLTCVQTDKGNGLQQGGNIKTILQATYNTDRRGSLPSDLINYNPYQSPETNRRRLAWGECQQRFQRDSYDSDSEISRSRNQMSPNTTPCGSPVFEPLFMKTKRRGLSEEGIRGVNNNTIYQQFYPPQLPCNRPQMMHQSQSQTNLNMLHRQGHPMVVRRLTSVDTSFANRDLIHQHVCLQSSMFVRLQAAITDATKEVERLEKDVAAKLLELDAVLSVKRNPTHKECLQLEEEVKKLTVDIQNMSTECDTIDIQNSSAECESPGLATPNDSLLKPKHEVKQISPPPPIPLRVPANSDHWACPKCTFENLLVSQCEICFAPRPMPRLR